jgi:acetyl esterase
VPIHPDVAARFHYLDGITSIREAYTTPAGLERIRQYESWEPAVGPPEVDIRDDVAPGPHGRVPVRIYTPPTTDGDVDANAPHSHPLLEERPGLVWLHGGGFIGGDLDMREGDWTAREVCARAGAVVVSVDYRLAVDGVHYPVPHDDTVAAVTWVRDCAADLGIDSTRISIGGASAGGNLTAGAALKLRDQDGWQPATLVLVYAVFHALTPSPSPWLAAKLAELPPLFQHEPEAGSPLHENYIGGALSAGDGYVFPASAVLGGLCSTLVINAEYDELRASGEAFTAALALAGVDVRQVLVPGVLHGFLNQPAELAPVAGCLDVIAKTVAA